MLGDKESVNSYRPFNMFILVVILLLASYCSCQDQHNTSLHVLAILSVVEGEDQGIAWTQGRDIFRGACEAAQDINKHPDLLPQFEVVPVPVLVPDCDPVKGIHKLLEALLDPSMNMIGVTGMFCDKVAEVYSPVLSQWARSLQISGATIPKEEDGVQLTSYILPSSEDVAEAVISLLNKLNWTRFGIVYAQPGYKNYSSFNYFNLAKTLIKERHDHNLSFYYELSGANLHEVNVFLQTLKSSEVHILVMLVPPHIATSVMQKVSNEGLVWPQYVWIFVHLEPAAIFLSPVWENVIFMSYRLPLLDGSNTSCAVSHNSTGTSYSSLLYDSVWGLALAWNNTLNNLPMDVSFMNSEHKSFVNNLWNSFYNLTFEGKTGQVNFNKRGKSFKLNVTFVKHNMAHLIGQYSFSNCSISLDNSMLQPIPPDRFQFRVISLPLTLSIPLFIWLFLMYALVTINLSLFLIFRKEREVKASSVPLSMCIFVGSYLMLFTPTNSVVVTGFIIDREKIRHITCNVEQISASIGFDLVVATALVRTLRIYHIFHHLGKLGKCWTDSRLVATVAAIISIKLYLFILWISADNNHLIDTVVFQHEAVPPHYLVIQPCYSDYQAVWVFAVYMYTVVLLVLLSILAIKTRKINHGDFKDTKKTTLLVLFLLLLLIASGLLWGILRQVGQPIASYISLDLGYSLGICISQIILFLPKVLPPLHRYLKHITKMENLTTTTNIFSSPSTTAITVVKSSDKKCLTP